jgi:hypothetical protein
MPGTGSGLVGRATLLGASFGIYRGKLLSEGSVKVDCFSGRDALLDGYEVGSFRW